MTTEPGSAAAAGNGPAPRGRIIIEWPALLEGNDALMGWGATISDADTGEVIPTATTIELKVRFAADSPVTAEVTYLTGADGEPARAAGDGSFAIGWDDIKRAPVLVTRHHYVAGMRVRT